MQLIQAFRQTLLRPSSLSSTSASVTTRFAITNPVFIAQSKRFLSDETRTAIDKAVASAPVVLFMKGTPETPQCGFSRATIQILGLQGVDPQKFTAFNVLEDQELRSGKTVASELLPFYEGLCSVPRFGC
jgi:monothiol glutaredoxin